MTDKPVKKNLYKVEFHLLTGDGFPSMSNVASPCTVRAMSFSEAEKLMLLFGERLANLFSGNPESMYPDRKYTGISIHSIVLMGEWIVDESDFDESDDHVFAYR